MYALMINEMHNYNKIFNLQSILFFGWVLNIHYVKDFYDPSCINSSSVLTLDFWLSIWDILYN